MMPGRRGAGKRVPPGGEIVYRVVMMKWLLVAGCVVLVSPAPADACSCVAPRFQVSPPSNIAAPLNTQIRVSWAVGVEEMKGATEASISLVPRGSKTAVIVDRKLWTSGEVSWLILTPRQPLAAKSAYEVVMAAAAGGRVVLGNVVTGTASDNDPPTWKGTGQVQYVHAPAVCCNCSTGDPWAAIEIAEGAGAVKDDVTEPGSIAFAVWPADGKLDSSRLLAIIPAWNGRLTLGHRSICSPRNFDLPATAKSLKLRIAPIDHAGNAGDPSPVTIDMTSPLQRAP
jgi:hypothetical protein